jgi:hypothetical protein
MNCKLSPMLNDAQAAGGASRAPAPAAMSGAAASTSRREIEVSGCGDTATDAATEPVWREVDMMSESALHWAGENASTRTGAYAARATAARYRDGMTSNVPARTCFFVAGPTHFYCRKYKIDGDRLKVKGSRVDSTIGRALKRSKNCI